MKVLKGILVFVVVLLIIGFIALAMARNVIIKEGAIKVIRESTGFDLELAEFHVGLFKPEVEIVGLRLLNPPDFPDREAFEVNRFYGRYELLSMFTDEVHFYELEIDIPKVVLVQKEDGEINLKRLADKGKEIADEQERKKERKEKRVEQKPGERRQPPAPPKPKEQKKEKGFRIDELRVKLGQAEMRTYSSDSAEPEVDVFEIRKEQTYYDVTSAEAIGMQIAAEVIAAHVTRNLNVWAEEHEEDLEKMGLKKDDVKKVEEGLKSFLKGFQ